MCKIKLIIPFLLLSSLVYSQTSTLIQNVNSRANELKHGLNKTGDSLYLQGERKIYDVHIFNANGKETYTIRGNKTEIPLSNLIVGRYVVEVILIDKRIILTLLRNEPLAYNSEIMQPKVTNTLAKKRATKTDDVRDQDSKADQVTADELAKAEEVKRNHERRATEEKEKAREAKEALVAERLKLARERKAARESEKVEAQRKIAANTSPKKRGTRLNRDLEDDQKPNSSKLDYKKENKAKSETEWSSANKEIKENEDLESNYHYWIVLEVNNGSYSNKTMKMTDIHEVKRLVEKNKLDIKTLKGKSNVLTVYQVYDNVMFSRLRYRDTNYLNTTSEYFNPVPYYKTVASGEEN